MATITSLKTRIFAAVSLCAVLACGAAMANDSYQNTIKDAVARNDTQLLTDTGGATFIGRSTGNGIQAPGTYRFTMQDAIARNDTQLLPDGFTGGATFNGGSNGSAVDQTAYRATMRNAIEHNNAQLLPESYAGGATFFN